MLLLDCFSSFNRLDFGQDNKQLFYIIQNYKLYRKLETSLKYKKNFKKIKINNKLFYKKILKENQFDLIINSEKNNIIEENFFYNKISKDYKSVAKTGIINHQKCINHEAIQIFTNCRYQRGSMYC